MSIYPMKEDRKQDHSDDPAVYGTKGSSHQSGGLLTLIGAVVTGVSFVAFVWGKRYVSANRFEGFTSAFGMSDGTYEMAQWAIPLGALGLLVGICMLIASFARSITGRK